MGKIRLDDKISAYGVNSLPTYALKVVLTAEDIYEKLSYEDKKRFNRVIITDVSRDLEMNLEITCVAVNDCPVTHEPLENTSKSEDEETQRCRSHFFP